MLEDIRLSFKGIWSHKMRSFLTMLGIIVGIAAVIAVVSTIKGTNDQIKNNLIGDGTNTVEMTLSRNGYSLDFSYEDVPDGVPVFDESIKEKILNVPKVKNATFYRKMDYVDSLFYGSKRLDGFELTGIDDRYFETDGMQIIKGRSFTPSDRENRNKVAVINKPALNSLGITDPIGKVIDINGDTFTIIGVADTKSQFEPVINSVEDYFTFSSEVRSAIYVPNEVWSTIVRYDQPYNVEIKAATTDDMTTAGNQVLKLLNSCLSVSSEENVKYQSPTLTQAANQLNSLSSSTNILMIGIASISLLVGGIGVMNIMLVSVTERTKEIGLKKALGAKKRRIRSQFLTEAMILSGLGGVLGIIAGIILSRIIAVIAVIPVSISIPSIIIAVVFSMAIGIIFGMVPSIKASNLNPIDALRYE